MSGPGDELAELLWDNGPHYFPPAPFQPFTCSAAGSSRAHELKRRADDVAAFIGSVPVGFAAAAMDDVVVAGLPVHDDDDAVPWLHCPVIDDGDSDTAPLQPEYCAGLMPGYSGLPAVAATAGIERLSSHGAVTRAVPPEAAVKLPQPSAGGGGEGVVNFTFFSRPLQRPQASAARSNHVESTVMQAAANRLRSTPRFSDQRMAWLQQPPKAPRATAAAPPPAPHAPLAPDHGHRAEAAATVTQHRSQPEALAPISAPAAAVTTSSVCSDNGDRSQLPKRSTHQPAECSVSPDEDFDDEPGAMRRPSAARGTKRGRTAEVHNMSERRRRDRINEKMRALQELIPNCNKIDKASMLEEAIEYLKTLQLQVQMMSMGTGLCVPPMMMPAMMQHMQMAHFPHHHHHLGMGLGLGMAAPAFDMVPIPRLPGGAQFPLHAMPMPPGAMFGVPGQGMPSPAALAHMAMASAAPVAEQMEAAARGGGDQPVPIVPQPQDDHQKLQHPKQT